MAALDTMPTGKYPAKAHAERVAAYIKSKDPNADGIIYLEAQKTRMIEDNDEAQPFRQRRYFFYLSGCNLPDTYLTYSLSSGQLILYIPPINPEEVMWLGLPLSKEEALQKYDVDEVRFSTDVNASLAGLAKSEGKAVYAIHPQVSDHVTFLEFGDKNLTLLKEAIEVTRVVKDEYEIGLIRHANAISAGAHHAVMKAVKHVKNERELEALFIQHCIAHGAREQAYHSIVASGVNGATLHYQKNDEPLEGRLNLLLDAGGEVGCYASDITRTFPISGKFSKKSREIYDIVLEMQDACIKALHSGVVWDEVHALAHKIAIKGLLELGILKGGSEEELFKSRTSVAFFPHGLGHYLGLDTHDTGGNPNYEDKDPMFRYLRVRGQLPAGSVVTVEPGIYFCKFIIDPYLADPAHSKYIDKDVLDKYWDVGGVRIEDNVLVTKDGYDNLTTTIKNVAEMEKVINGSERYHFVGVAYDV